MNQSTNTKKTLTRQQQEPFSSPPLARYFTLLAALDNQFRENAVRCSLSEEVAAPKRLEPVASKPTPRGQVAFRPARLGFLISSRPIALWPHKQPVCRAW